MKPVYSYIFSFISLFLLYIPLFGFEQVINKEEKLPALAALVDDMAFSTLIYTMHTLEDNLEYWQEQLKNSRTYTFFRNSAKAKSAIKDHIRALKDIELIHAKALGKLHTLRNTDRTSLEYCTKLLEILSTFIHIAPEPDNKKLDDKDLEVRLSAAINQLSTYKKSFDRGIYTHTKPSHFTRNWWKYLLGVAAISALGFTAYEYKQNILQGYNRALETLEQQWQQRIVDPIQGIIRNISLENYETSQKSIEETLQAINQKEKDISNMKEALEEKEKQFESDLRKYLKKKPYISKHMADNLTARVLNNNDSSLTNDITEQIYNFTFSNWFKSLFRNILPIKQNLYSFRLVDSATINGQFHKLKFDKAEYEAHGLVLQVLKLLYQVKQQLYLQEVNIMLSNMLPAALTGYAAYKLSTNAFSTLFFKKVILIPLQERILSIRKMLNRFDDGEQKELSAENTGHLVYWAHKLRQYIVQIPDEQQKSFKQDIQELESMELTIKQKHEVVKRMYDVYGFLKVTSNLN